MEILFENTYMFDERVAGEYMRYSILRTPRLYIVVSMFVVIASMLLYVKQYAYAAVFLAIFLVWILISVRSYKQGVKRMTEKSELVSGSLPNVTRFEFGSDCFVAHSSGTGTVVIPYRDLKRVTDMGQTIMLIVKGGAKYALPKNAFIKGTEEEFSAFIKEKAGKK
ncbi:MAG: YcxB family protein [Clostridia bacterium]|nr:YcxB family protein [Clostridia bacterium]